MPLVAFRQRPRSDQAHLSPHDIDQLRPLVNERVPQNVSKPSRPRIMLKFEKTFRLSALPLQVSMQSLSLPRHGPELKHSERRAPISVAHLLEDHRPPVAHPDQQRRQQHHRRTGNQQAYRQCAFRHSATLRLGIQSKFKHPLTIRSAAPLPHQHRHIRGRYHRVIPFSNSRRQEVEHLPRPAIPLICKDYTHIRGIVSPSFTSLQAFRYSRALRIA